MTMPGRYIDTVIETFYDSFCGPPGQERNWDPMCALFMPGAHITRADVPEDGCTESIRLYVREFAESIEGFLEKNGFYGLEIARRTEMSGNLASVLSVYEGRFNLNDEEPFRRGTNRIRLYHDGDRWWITNMLLREFRDDDLYPANQQSIR